MDGSMGRCGVWCVSLPICYSMDADQSMSGAAFSNRRAARIHLIDQSIHPSLHPSNRHTPKHPPPPKKQDVPPLIAASKYTLVNIYREELFLVRFVCVCFMYIYLYISLSIHISIYIYRYICLYFYIHSSTSTERSSSWCARVCVFVSCGLVMNGHHIIHICTWRV